MTVKVRFQKQGGLEKVYTVLTWPDLFKQKEETKRRGNRDGTEAGHLNKVNRSLPLWGP